MCLALPLATLFAFDTRAPSLTVTSQLGRRFRGCADEAPTRRPWGGRVAAARGLRLAAAQVSMLFGPEA